MSDVEIKLSKDEALVLFEFLGRFSNEDILGIEDQSEARVLWNLECLLEKVNTGHSPNYSTKYYCHKLLFQEISRELKQLRRYSLAISVRRLIF